MRIPPTPLLLAITLAQVCVTIVVLVMLLIVGLSQSRSGELYASYAEVYLQDATNNPAALTTEHIGYSPDGIARKAHERTQADCRLIVKAQGFTFLLLVLSSIGVLLALVAQREARNNS
jgi:hypothetical protein